MILFFYGEDTYRLRQKINALKEKFISASLGDTNLAVLDGERLTYDELVRQVLAMPFLSKTRLVIVENLLNKAKKEILEKIPQVLDKVPNSTVLALVQEGMPDRRTSLFKKLIKEKTEEFRLFDDAQLRRWITREIENRKSKFEPEAINKLIEFVGNDLWRMKNELDKLSAYSKNITASDVELLVTSQIKSDIFAMIDSISKKNVKNATREFYKLINNGQNELYILTMIVYQYRNLLIIRDLMERTKISNSFALAKKTGLHPFVVKKSLDICRHYSLSDLKEIYLSLQDYDFKIKTGKIEPRTALELLIYRLTTQ